MPTQLHLSSQNGEHLVRCVSEGLTNVARHANATHIWITVTEENEQAHLQIRDDGQGFDSDGRIPAGHYGLLGLRERARLANGKLTIESQSGTGTILSMSIPIEA